MRGLPADQRVVTPRRLEVLRLAASGYSNADIAKQLWISEESVKSHFRLAYEQLGARDRTHAVAICLVRGLIHPHEVELPMPRAAAQKPASACVGASGAVRGVRDGRDGARTPQGGSEPREEAAA